MVGAVRTALLKAMPAFERRCPKPDTRVIENMDSTAFPQSDVNESYPKGGGSSDGYDYCFDGLDADGVAGADTDEFGEPAEVASLPAPAPTPNHPAIGGMEQAPPTNTVHR